VRREEVGVARGVGLRGEVMVDMVGFVGEWWLRKLRGLAVGSALTDIRVGKTLRRYGCSDLQYEMRLVLNSYTSSTIAQENA
jgi:hypothetical protein